MFDVFYYNQKPNLFAFEKPADSLDHAASLSTTEFFWYVDGNNDYTGFNFDWQSVPWEQHQVHVFPSQHQTDGNVYFAPKKLAVDRQLNFRQDQCVRANTSEIFFVDHFNPSSNERYAGLQVKYPTIQRVRYVDNEVDTIKRCAAKSRFDKFWVIDSRNRYDDFDFTWHPMSWDNTLTHVFPTKWHKWGNTFLLSKSTFLQHADWIKTLSELPNLSFVSSQSATADNDQLEIHYVDHGNAQNNLEDLRARFPQIKVTRFVDTYLDTFKRIASNSTADTVWIVSSLCDYTDFDFSWYPDPWQEEMLHCFGTDGLKKGDTFYMNVAEFRKQMVDIELLDWFNVVCYHEDTTIERYPVPVVYYTGDNLVATVAAHTFTSPYVAFMNRPGQIGIEPCVWRQQDRVVLPVTQDNGSALIPRDVKQYLKTQIYDYPYIDVTMATNQCRPMEVVFISYDETDADKNWEILKQQCPRAKRLHGVEGMDNALKQAAEMSISPWYYAVFAKTVVHPDFKFDFQPDLFQQPKHYIFHAQNPMNGLVYGHMGIVMYNCNIAKSLQSFGIDYTMSAAHEVVPQVSAVAAFNTTPYQTWRTAFREVAKLSQFNDESPTIENSYRLKVWCTKAQGDHAEWCLQGARDAVAFYTANSHDKAQLKNAFDWAWLKQYFTSLHGKQ